MKKLPEEIKKQVDTVAKQHVLSPLLYRSVLSRTSNLPLNTFHKYVPVKILKKRPQGVILRIHHLGNKDAYNPALIVENGIKYLALRIESHDSFWLDPVSYDPKAMFFQEQADGSWDIVPGSPIFTEMEDPFACWIATKDGKQELVFGGVRVLRDEQEPYIATQFFRAKSIKDLDPEKPFAQIKYMKDIRLVQRGDGKIVVFTRPTGGAAGRGMIGVTVIDDLTELTQAVVEQATLLTGQVDPSVKLGPNQAQLIQYEQNGEVKEELLVLGHIAFEDEKTHLHYYAMTFRIDPYLLEKTPAERLRPKIVATRESFEHAVGKEAMLRDVVFPGALEWISDHEIGIYAGVGDAKTGYVRIPYEFLSYS